MNTPIDLFWLLGHLISFYLAIGLIIYFFIKIYRIKKKKSNENDN